MQVLKESSKTNINFVMYVCLSAIATVTLTFQWSLILKSAPIPSKWYLSFGLQLLKPLSIYALRPLFHTPRPFFPLYFINKLLFVQQHISRSYPFCNFCYPPLPLQLSIKLYPKPHTTIGTVVQRLNSKGCLLIPILRVVVIMLCELFGR